MIGNAGEYFVMGELLRRGCDAQLADRNTKGYDLLVVGRHSSEKVEVKTSRTHSWRVKPKDFTKFDRLNQITVYVHISKDLAKHPRYFIVRNRDIRKRLDNVSMWKALLPNENRWKELQK